MGFIYDKISCNQYFANSDNACLCGDAYFNKFLMLKHKPVSEFRSSVFSDHYHVSTQIWRLFLLSCAYWPGVLCVVKCCYSLFCGP